PLRARRAWAKQARRDPAVRARTAHALAALVATPQGRSSPADQRLADAELLRAAVFLDGLARPCDVVVPAGDFNVPAVRSSTQAELTNEDWGFSEPAAEGIDQILVRGASVGGGARGPVDRRPAGGRVR